MATITGANLLDSVLTSTGVTMGDAVKAVTAARLQQMLDAGFNAGTSIALVLSAASSDLRTAVPVLADLAATVETAKDEITGGVVPDFALTAEDDTFLGADGDELIVGTTATLSANDRLMDASITDNDTFNLTATADPAIMDVTNIENINIDWDAYGTPDVDLDEVTGATVSLTSEKVGYLGNANFVNVKDNNIVTGTGVTGTVAIGAIEDASVTAASVKTLTIGGVGAVGSATEAADGDLVVTADAATSVTVDGADNLTLSALMATTVTLNVSQTAALTTGVDYTLDLTGAANATGEFTLSAAAASTATIATGSLFDLLTVAPDSEALTLSFEAGVDLSGQEIVNGGAIIVEDAMISIDLGKVSSTSITFETASGGAVVVDTVTGANIVLEANNNAGGTTFDEAEDGAADTITVTTETDQAGALIFNTASQEFETATIVADGTVVATPGTIDVTLADVQATAGNVVLVSAANDLEVEAISAAQVDASAVANDLILAQGAVAEDLIVIGGTGDNDITFDAAASTNDSTFIGSETVDTDDTVTFNTTTGAAVAVVNGGDNDVVFAGILATTGTATVIAGSGDDSVDADAATTGTVSAHLGDGANSVTALGLTAGVLSVTGGAGVDTVSTDDSVTTGTVTLDLGAGNNIVNMQVDAVGVSTHSITTGAGNDTVNLTGDLTDDVVTLTLGEGTNTLAIDGDISAATDLTVTGLDVIADADSTAVVSAALLNGQSYLITSNGVIADTLEVIMATTLDSVDFSNIVIDNTITKGLAGLDITGTGDNNTIIATDGADTIDGGAGTNTITGGLGADTMTSAGTADTFVIASADTGATVATADSITGFGTTVDKLSLGVAGTATNFATGTGAADEATALGLANTAFNGTIKYYYASAITADIDGAGTVYAAGDSLLFIDADLDGTADDVIGLVGLSVGDLVATDIIA